MLDRETLLTLFGDTANVFTYNLDFIPNDKLDWKPAPESKSALEIVNHLCPFLDSVSGALGAPTQSPASATNRDEAKKLMTQTAERYVSAVRGASSDVLSAQFRPDMPLSNGWMVTAATLDTIHHTGQIAYIQTLLGDNEIHFDETTLPAWAVN